MWEFGGLRKSAIDNLDGGSNPLGPVHKLILALRYVTEWTIPALLQLAQRPEPISIEEGRIRQVPYLTNGLAFNFRVV